MTISLGQQVFHPGHGWVSTFESCDCAECSAGDEECDASAGDEES